MLKDWLKILQSIYTRSGATVTRTTRVGIEGLRFESIHYTPDSPKSQLLHGHTFRVDIVVEGEPDNNGMVIDFRQLRKLAESIIAEWDQAIIVPLKDKGHIRINGPFKVKRILIPFNTATTENIACALLEELLNALKRETNIYSRLHSVLVRVWESYDRYAECMETLR